MAFPSLQTEQVRKIEKLIAGWLTKLTWHLLVERIKSDLNITTTRQTLNTYASIKSVYDNKKQELRGKPTTEFTKFVKSDVDRFEQIQRLKAQNEMLNHKVDMQLSFIKKLTEVARTNPQLMLLLNKIKNEVK